METIKTELRELRGILLEMQFEMRMVYYYLSAPLRGHGQGDETSGEHNYRDFFISFIFSFVLPFGVVIIHTSSSSTTSVSSF